MSRALSLLFALVFTVSAWSAVPEGSVEETISPAPAAPRLAIDLYGWGYSSAFSNFNGKKVNADATSGGPMDIVTQIIPHYPAFAGLDFEVTLQFALQPTQGQAINLNNPTVGLQGVLVETGGFSYWARMEAAVPLTQKSRDEGMLFAPQVINTLGYRFEGTKLKLEVVAIPSFTVFNNGTTSTGLYVSPRLYYLVNDSLWLVGLAEGGASADRGTGFFNFHGNGPYNLGVGFRYTSLAGRGLWVQPFFNFNPGGRLVSNGHLGVFFGGPLL